MKQKFPGKMTPKEFFKLPISESLTPGLQDLQNKDDPTGFVDAAGVKWRWIIREDGTYARERLCL